MTGGLGRQVLEAVAIVAVTTAALAGGRVEGRSGLRAAARRRRRTSAVAVALALGAVALVAAMTVVVLFDGTGRGRDAATRTPAQQTQPASEARSAQR